MKLRKAEMVYEQSAISEKLWKMESLLFGLRSDIRKFRTT